MTEQTQELAIGCTPCRLLILAISSYVIAWCVALAVTVVLAIWLTQGQGIEAPTSQVWFPAALILWWRLRRVEKRLGAERKALGT